MAPPAPKLQKFTRAMRVKQGRDFVRARREGERRVFGCLIANWRRLPPGSSPRLGLVTGHKIGNAVVRNRARRLLREAFRLHRNEFAQPVDLILVARASIVGKPFCDVEKDFLITLRKAGLFKQVS